MLPISAVPVIVGDVLLVVVEVVVSNIGAYGAVLSVLLSSIKSVLLNISLL